MLRGQLADAKKKADEGVIAQLEEFKKKVGFSKNFIFLVYCNCFKLL